MSDPFGANETHVDRGSAAGPREPLSGSADERRQGAGGLGQASAGAEPHETDQAPGTIVEQIRSRLSEIVAQQKAAGADTIAGVASAAKTAAADLDKSNPQLAGLVRSAAESVDRIADDVRSRDLGDVLDTLGTFGRRQPVAFFGGALVAGFLIARFFKSDAPVVAEVGPSDAQI